LGLGYKRESSQCVRVSVVMTCQHEVVLYTPLRCDPAVVITKDDQLWKLNISMLPVSQYAESWLCPVEHAERS
jgi:hypothetical protein